MNFEQLISSLQPVNDAIDGTPKQRKRGKRGQGPPAVGRRWHCNLCGHEEPDQDAMLAHLQAELTHIAASRTLNGMISQQMLSDVSIGITAVADCIARGELTAAPGIIRLFRGAAVALAIAAACDPETGDIDINLGDFRKFRGAGMATRRTQEPRQEEARHG